MPLFLADVVDLQEDPSRRSHEQELGLHDVSSLAEPGQNLERSRDPGIEITQSIIVNAASRTVHVCNLIGY